MTQQRILVVGGGLGIGDCVTNYLVGKHGAKVVVQSLQVSDRIRRLESQGDVVIVEGDATKPATLEKTFQTVTEHLGGLDAVVVTLGIIGEIETVARLDIDKMRTAFDINFFVPVQLSQQYLPLLRASKGRLIILSSMVDKEISYAGWSPYSTSKAALTRFIELLAHEEEDAVGVYGVYPGLTRTPMVTDLVAGKFKGKMKDAEVEKFRTWDREDGVEPPEWSANVTAKLAVGAIEAEPGKAKWYYDIDPDYKN